MRYDNKFFYLEKLLIIVERLQSSSTNKDESPPHEICSLVMGGRGEQERLFFCQLF